jgi:hypothetical protein
MSSSSRLWQKLTDRSQLAAATVWLACVLAAGAALSLPAQAQRVERQPRPAPAAAAGPAWSELTPRQQAALAPLRNEWATMDAPRREKWLELAGRFPRMSADEQARVRQRMSEWARMSPEQRGQARLNFQEARQLPPQERQSRWEAYQSLSPEQRRALAAQAGSLKPSEGKARSSKLPLQAPRSEPPDRGKSNIVPNPRFVAQPKRITPTEIQAKPGASTNLMTKPASPPPHQQTGLPKVAATPGFVDDETLLPRRGPQGAATLAPKRER